MELIIYLLIGAIAGFTAGLFGVGGGSDYCADLYIVFTQLAVRSQGDYAYGGGHFLGNDYCDFYQFGDGASSARAA